jgi:anti-sigma B factor antagonist
MATDKAIYIPAMEIAVQREHDTCIIDLSGDLDFGACLLLDEAIKMALQDGLALTRLYVNCKQLQFISSAGIGVFVENLHLLQTHKVVLIMYGMNHVVRDVFSIVGLDTYFPIVNSKQEADRICHGY